MDKNHTSNIWAFNVQTKSHFISSQFSYKNIGEHCRVANLVAASAGVFFPSPPIYFSHICPILAVRVQFAPVLALLERLSGGCGIQKCYFRCTLLQIWINATPSHFFSHSMVKMVSSWVHTTASKSYPIPCKLVSWTCSGYISLLQPKGYFLQPT